MLRRNSPFNERVLYDKKVLQQFAAICWFKFIPCCSLHLHLSPPELSTHLAELLPFRGRSPPRSRGSRPLGFRDPWRAGPTCMSYTCRYPQNKQNQQQKRKNLPAFVYFGFCLYPFTVCRTPVSLLFCRLSLEMTTKVSRTWIWVERKTKRASCSLSFLSLYIYIYIHLWHPHNRL